MEVNISHNLTRKASVGMYYTYVLIAPTTLVCLLFSTAIPTSLFIKQLFFVLVVLCNVTHVHVQCIHCANVHSTCDSICSYSTLVK